jgi:glyoxylase-like metal-dependent hydrolase (beta-lactamase superfamily II)
VATRSRRIDLGGCAATLLDGGRFKLDGGAMFGIIPKPLWTRNTPADEQNRIQLACNCLLIEWASGRRAIVECGRGGKYDEKERKIFDIDPAVWLLPSLQAINVGPESITDVVLTHLHFDHCGGLTFEQAGRLLPTFPKARVHAGKREFDDARANFGVMTNTYREANYTPIDDLDAWVLHDGQAEPLPGVHVRPTPGHTRGHQSVIIAGSERTLLFLGDVMPTRSHVGVPYNMGYDLFPLDNVASKRVMLSEAAEKDWLIVIDHEPDQPLVRAAPDGRHFALAPVE